ncbi:MAG: hypothetical protein GC171_14825 [Terrimonas sp.]|nr:hypothetical protein [Terrimonas sp.]
MKQSGLLMVIVMILSLTQGCLKKTDACKNKTPQEEETTILAYASANGINAVKHSSGLYYEITDPGTGNTPSPSSLIKVTYTGKLLDGQVFDQLSTPPAQGWPLYSLIQGWQIGIPLIKEGGSIKLIIPSSLAYGCEGSSPIPGNTILYFEVNLVQVQ